MVTPGTGEITFEVTVIRCANWEHNPEMCGMTCGVIILPEDMDSWGDAVQEAGWFIVLNGRQGHRHARPFCSVACYNDAIKAGVLTTDAVHKGHAGQRAEAPGSVSERGPESGEDPLRPDRA